MEGPIEDRYTFRRMFPAMMFGMLPYFAGTAAGVIVGASDNGEAAQRAEQTAELLEQLHAPAKFIDEYQGEAQGHHEAVDRAWEYVLPIDFAVNALLTVGAAGAAGRVFPWLDRVMLRRREEE